MKQLLIPVFLSISLLIHGQDWSEFRCDGSGKCLGLEFAFKYPSNWTSKPGTRPHMIVVMDHEDSKGLIQMGAYVKKLEVILNEEDFNDVINPQMMAKIFPGSELISFNDKAKIDGEKCAIAVLKATTQIYDKMVRSIVKVNMIVWKDYLLQVNFFVYSYDNAFETEQILFEKYEPTFNEVMYNLALLSKWK